MRLLQSCLTSKRSAAMAAKQVPFWNKQVPLTYGGFTDTVPLTNFGGHNYPALYEDLMIEALEIRKRDRVLEIGGGDAPFMRADVVTDAFLENSEHRCGRPIAQTVQYVEARAEELPFADKEFDFAYSRMVFEHVEDPAKACAEMQR